MLCMLLNTKKNVIVMLFRLYTNTTKAVSFLKSAWKCCNYWNRIFKSIKMLKGCSIFAQDKYHAKQSIQVKHEKHIQPLICCRDLSARCLCIRCAYHDPPLPSDTHMPAEIPLISKPAEDYADAQNALKSIQLHHCSTANMKRSCITILDISLSPHISPLH